MEKELAPVDSKTPWDNGTLYASAFSIMKQEYKHNLKSVDLKLPTDARRAHKFVSMNLTDAAINILCLSGDNLANAQMAVIEMKSMIIKEEKRMLQ